MTFLRTVAALALLNATIHAQPTPTATDATAVIDHGRAAVFATITNPTMYDLYIVSGTSESAVSVDFVDGKEEKVVTSFTVPAFGSLMLQPTLARLRLHGLKNQLKVGDELKLTLETDGGVGIPIAAIVKATNP
jgi:copper(I)-binding protein